MITMGAWSSDTSSGKYQLLICPYLTSSQGGRSELFPLSMCRLGGEAEGQGYLAQLCA
jgi:hypothetical protein